jgi:DNA polymerase II large subunit
VTDDAYFRRLEARLAAAREVAERAREQGHDPETEVEIPQARDMADRVEKVLGIDGVAGRVRELEGTMSREEAALALVEDFVEGSVGDFETRAGKIEGAVRTAVALLTEGVVAAPIEGIDRVEVLQNDDGSEFVNIYYAGPIRSAGGTAQALSVLVADYARSLLGLGEYRARASEVERYAEEVTLYDEGTGLQYSPTDAESKHVARNMPVMLDGEATGDEAVSGYRDLERVDTNNPRGGMCLVLAEGIALKAPKIRRYTRDLEAVAWPWLEDLIDGTAGEDDAEDADGDDVDGTADGPPRADPSKKYLRDLIAGRPVFGHPSESGGFRLRYGRARNHGHATAGVHPATMRLVDDFLAAGTQLKTERPGKAAGVVPVDTIEGPTVRLADGDVRRIDDPAEARAVRNGVEAVLDLGEYLVNYGEFVENNHDLVPASYAPEWWVQQFEAAGADVVALADDPTVDLDHPDVERALSWATEYDAPLHPEYTYLWHDVTAEDALALARAVDDATVDPAQTRDDAPADRLLLPDADGVRETLERLLVEHHQDDPLEVPVWRPLVRSLGFEVDTTGTGTPTVRREWRVDDLSEQPHDAESALSLVETVAPFRVRERAPTRVGCRMGRPEKSEQRELSPAVHTLFPLGEAGGNQRDVAAAAEYAPDRRSTPGVVSVDVARRVCPDCGTETYESRCDCGTHTEPRHECPDCGRQVDPDEADRTRCPRCDVTATAVEERAIHLDEVYHEALRTVGERESAFDVLKGVKGLTSTIKTPEPVEKGVLRAKHGVSAFKDGTVRYDMTDLPVTVVRPAELDVTPDHLRELGYETDVHGDPLRHDDQLVELKVQDVVLSEGAADHLLSTADFVDDLLAEFYDLAPFYEFEERDDLVGELVFGMAPHTSAAVVGRVVGFTAAAVGYAHPYFHASKRRNCFHPDTKLWYSEDGAWHHERIEDFVADRLDEADAETDDFGTLTDTNVEDVLVPSLTSDGDRVCKSVEALSRHRSPDHLVEVRTRSGRSLTVTPDHELQVYDDEAAAIRTRPVRAVDGGDRLVTPAHLDAVRPASEPKRFDLLAEFLSTDEVDSDRLTVEGLPEAAACEWFEDGLAGDRDDEFDPPESTADSLGLSTKTLDDCLSREGLPASVLVEAFGSVDEVVERVPEDVTLGLGLERDRTSIDRIVELDGRVATLLGYYAAEGYTRARPTSQGTVHRTTICDTADEPREFLLDTLREEFGVDPSEATHAETTVPGRLFRTFFDTVLDAGTDATTKRVPQPVFDASDGVVTAFLSGYFGGAGSVAPDALELSATTASSELRSDVLALLTRLGLHPVVEDRDPVDLPGQFPDRHEAGEATAARRHVIRLRSRDLVAFERVAGLHRSPEHERLDEFTSAVPTTSRRAPDGGDDGYYLDPVVSIEIRESDVEHVYDLTVADTHSLVAGDVFVSQCDGDEDCVMLLMDGLLNFSERYLPDQRGGRMDAPLVMTSRVDPTEIDDEAHNVDVVSEYPLELYEASREMAHPEAVDVEIAADRLGTDHATSGFGHTHDTSDIAAGPDLSAYKTLGEMEDKMDAQLELARKLRAVDETDVAERIIEYHFLPDLIGNLRAFSQQETRCLDCGETYRRPPLSSDCRECGGDVTLTVHEGSVTKYLDTASRVAEEYGARTYTKQRIEVLERSIESVFENDKNKATSLADFMGE